MGQQAEDLFVLQIDPETGSLRQFVSDVPGSNYPTAALMSRTGKLYVGAAYAGHLLCFDPDEEALEDLGPINPGAAVFPCRIDEGPDGTIWIGSYGTADLTSYDPETRRFTRYGPMDDVDMYNHPFVDADGKVVCFIRTTKLHVVAFDPRSRKFTSQVPLPPGEPWTSDFRTARTGRSTGPHPHLLPRSEHTFLGGGRNGRRRLHSARPYPR